MENAYQTIIFFSLRRPDESEEDLVGLIGMAP